MKNSRLNPMYIASIEIFCAAASSNNFTSAAALLGITPAAVSRSVKRLEKRIGVPLFNRTTRNISLTGYGQIYYKKCHNIIDEIKELHQCIENEQSLKGTLRITAPELFSNFILLPIIAKFCEVYPYVKIELHVTSRNINLVQEEFDLAFRLHKEDTKIQSHLICKQVLTTKTGIYVSSSYITNHGIPEHMEDLEHHSCINFRTSYDNRSFPWVFSGNYEESINKINNKLTILDNIESAKKAAEDGLGLVQLFDFSVTKSIKSGKLIEVLKKYKSNDQWVFSELYSGESRKSEKIKIFSDFLQHEISLMDKLHLSVTK